MFGFTILRIRDTDELCAVRYYSGNNYFGKVIARWKEPQVKPTKQPIAGWVSLK